ncbi:MAG: zf-HC2 domain-containing protein [Actinomycetota bacterium]
MTAEMTCEQVRGLAPELALDIAAGDERDTLLHHLIGCPECRRLAAELSSLSDELLLLLAPAHEPGLGFESRVLDALAEPSRPRRNKPLAQRRRWVSAAAAAVIVAAALGGGSVFLATSDDRQLAQSYRATLDEGQGSFFAAAPLTGSQGRIGTVFGYEGRPSWVMVTMEPALGEERPFEVQVVTADGKYLVVGDAVLGGNDGTWGREIPVDLSEVHEFRFVGADGQIAFTATLDAADPWE